ncbi:MAG: PAS domain S-box protein [Flammeovirgaceae bacterium]|nr:PAS domain S-box protein [Flammeovirgaceae bacterium]
MSKTEINQLFGKANNIFILLDERGKLLKTDNNWYVNLGYQSEFTLGEDLAKFVVEKELLQSFFQTYLFTKKSSQRLFLTFIKKNHEQLKLELTLNPDSESLQFIGLINPIPEIYGSKSKANSKEDFLEKNLRNKTNELKKVKEILEKERLRLSLSINKMEDPIMFKNAKSVITGCNQAFANLLGREIEDIIGKTDFDLFPKETAILFQNMDKKTMVSGKPQRNEEWQKRDGKMVLFDIIKTPLVDNLGNTIGLIGVGRDISKQKAIESELKNAKLMLQKVLDTIPVSVFWKDRNSVYLGGNLTLARYLGLKNPEQLIGKTDNDFFRNKDEVSNYQQDDKWVMDNDIVKLNYEECLTSKSGEKVWIRTSKIPLTNETNEVYGVLGVFEDITDWKTATEALIISEDKFRMLADNVPGVIYLCNNDKNWTIIYLNSKVEDLTGYPKDLFLEGKISFPQLYHPEDVDNIYKTVDEQLSSSGKFQLEYRLKHKDGHWVWVEEIGVSVSKNGEVLHLEGFISDISYRKKAESELNKLALIASETNNAIIITDKDEKIKWVNEEFVRLTEYSQEEVIGKNPGKLLQGPESDPKTISKIKEALINQQSIKAELLNYSKFGKKYWNEISIQPVFNKKNELIQYFAIQNDITLRKTQEQAIKNHNEGLKKTNQELDNFVYRVSHDLRAPIASSLGLITLARSEKSDSKLQEYLDLQEKSLFRLDEFIRDILNYSRNSRMELKMEEINFAELIEETFQNYHYLEEAKNVERILEINQTDVFYSDIRRLSVILNNLLSNALRFSNSYIDNSWIKVTINSNSENATIEISDNGIGIKPEHISKIFKMFYRATDVKKGSGLGLYIVKESIEKLAGKITVQSDVNKGTEFTITIPSLKA